MSPEAILSRPLQDGTLTGVKFWVVAVALGVGLATVGGVISWVALGDGAGPSVWTVTGDDPKVAFGAEDMGRVNRSLARRTLRVAKADPAFRRVVGSSPMLVVGTAVGFPATGAVALKLTVVRAGPVTADLPYWDMSGSIEKNAPIKCRYPHYVLGWIRDQATGIFAVYVTVDLPHRKVILIRTRAHRHVYSWIAGKPHPSCPQSKGPA